MLFESGEIMDKVKFYNLSEGEQKDYSSRFRKTVHDGEIVFLNDDSAKSLTPEEVKRLLIKQRNDLLISLGELGQNDEYGELCKNDNYRINR